MFVEVKIVDSTGKLKGRGYTYQSDMDLSVGDKVIADMGGNDKVLEVVKITEDPHADYEIKTIKSIYVGDADSDGVMPEETIDIEIIKEQLPVIQINFDTLKAELMGMLEKYKNIVVTEQSLAGCKSTQKQLAGLRIKIDNYRKDKKKELSLPIVAFEDQCKELVALIGQAEDPIKEGIAVFDDEKRLEKLNIAKAIMAEVAEEVGLNEKYAALMAVQSSYSNLTATKADVKNDATARAMVLKSEQGKEAELLAIIADTIEDENKNLKKKMDIKNFERLIGTMSTREVIAEIKAMASTIYDAEHPVEVAEATVEEEVEEAIEEVEAEIIEPSPQEDIKADISYFGVYRIWGNLSELQCVSAYLKEHKISYTVESEGEM